MIRLAGCEWKYAGTLLGIPIGATGDEASALDASGWAIVWRVSSEPESRGARFRAGAEA
jgi:hypothetical protein